MMRMVLEVAEKDHRIRMVGMGGPVSTPMYQEMNFRIMTYPSL